MKQMKQAVLTGERALFHSQDLQIIDATFADGESPLKESSNISLMNSIFKWKYPLWYSKHIQMENVTLMETARSGIWYTDQIHLINCTIEAPKTFRRSTNITLEKVTMPIADETLWNCHHVKLQQVSAKGSYFGMNSTDMQIDDFDLSGNYAFDGASKLHIRHARLLSKDAFWNCEDVIVEDSLIIGEYLGWNAKNITFINCTIDSLQGMCYMDHVTLINCKVLNTTLAFEYSHVDADITTEIDSVLNPYSGTIKAKRIKELILEADKINPMNTEIIMEDTYEYAV